MKKFISVLLTLVMTLALCSCGGSFAQVDLREPITIPEDGIISASILDQLKNENAIGKFCGENNGYSYEWTIFGSDLAETHDVNLALTLESLQNRPGFRIAFSKGQEPDFPAVLSVSVGKKWDVPGATVYQDTQDQPEPVCSASVTGSKSTIVNFAVTHMTGDFLVIPDPEQQETVLTGSEAADAGKAESAAEQDDYLSETGSEPGRVYSDGKGQGQDQYLTDPVPEGRPLPVEPENQQVDGSKTHTCTFSIECSAILNNLENLEPDKREMVPSGGVILAPAAVAFSEGESVYDVLQRVCRENGIHMEASFTPMYNSAYVEGIHNLYEFDCGQESGWMYRVNGWYPNYGCSRYQLAEGDVVEWRYTCSGLGKDIGADWMG